MDLSIGRGGSYVSPAETSEKIESNELWGVVSGILSDIKSSFSSFADGVSESLDRLKGWVLGIKNVSKERSVTKEAVISESHNRRPSEETQKSHVVVIDNPKPSLLSKKKVFSDRHNMGPSGETQTSHVVVIDNPKPKLPLLSKPSKESVLSDRKHRGPSGETQTSHVVVDTHPTSLSSKEKTFFDSHNRRPSGETQTSNVVIDNPKPKPSLLSKPSKESVLSDRKHMGPSGETQTSHVVVDNPKPKPPLLSKPSKESVLSESRKTLGLYDRKPVAVEVKPLPHMSIPNIRQRWTPMRNKLDSMLNLLKNPAYRHADGKNVLFDSNFVGDGINNVWGVSECYKLIDGLLNRKADTINWRLDNNALGLKHLNDADIEFMQREMIAIEKVLVLLEMALQARQKGDTTEAIHYETVLLGNILHMCFRENPKLSSADKASADRKQKGHSDMWREVSFIINTIEDLKNRVPPSDVDRVKKKMDPVLFDKSQQLFEMVEMFEDQRLTLRKMDDSDPTGDTDFQKIFHKKYSGWHLRSIERAERLLFTLLLIDTDVLDSENTTDIKILRRYAESLDEAKRLFYEAKDRKGALQAAADILSEVFNIQPRDT